MSKIIQQNIFSWKDVEGSGELERLKMVIEAMPDDELMKQLEGERKGRRDDNPVRAVWNIILAGIVYQHVSIESLRRELMMNGLVSTIDIRGQEMRLQGIKSIEEDNRFLAGYLPGYNRRFAVQAKKEKDLHREIPQGIELDNILCIRTQRGLRNDYTVAYNKRLYQIMDKTEARKVQVEEKIKGSMAITFEGRRLKFKEITERPEIPQKKPLVFVLKKRTNYVPVPSNHPWRQGLKSQRLPRAHAK